MSEYTDTKRETPYIAPVMKWKVIDGALYQNTEMGWQEHACGQLARDIAEDYAELFRKYVKRTVGPR